LYHVYLRLFFSSFFLHISVLWCYVYYQCLLVNTMKNCHLKAQFLPSEHIASLLQSPSRCFCLRI
jgi:sensor histidine kinase YesM